MLSTLDITLIIRGAQERTEAACRHLLSTQVDHIHLIHETPFSQAIRKSFEIGIAGNRTWICCVDADVLAAPGAVEDLQQYMLSRKPETFMVQGLILDKLFGVIRAGGIHFYRTELIKKALQLIPKEGSTVRPETTMVNAMGAQGFPWVQANLVSGLHDYEQFYADIYRKCFVQARKHASIAPFLKVYWKGLAESDKDFQMALWGLEAGQDNNQMVYIDRERYLSAGQSLLAAKGWSEKKPLPTDKYSSQVIEEYIQLHRKSISPIQEEIGSKFSYHEHLDVYKYGKSKDSSSPLYRVGYFIERVGKRIKNLG